MSSLLKKAYVLFVGEEPTALPAMPHIELPKRRSSRPLSKRELIQRESEIGGQLFGPVPKGHHRTFFNLDAQTWIWHEEWTDHRRQHRTATTRYEIHENGVLKAQEGARYNFIEGQELENFLIATRVYYEQVMRDIYRCDPETGQLLQPSFA